MAKRSRSDGVKRYAEKTVHETQDRSFALAMILSKARRRPFAILCVAAPVLSTLMGLVLVKTGGRSLMLFGLVFIAFLPCVSATCAALVSRSRREGSPLLLGLGMALGMLPAIALVWQLQDLHIVR